MLVVGGSDLGSICTDMAFIHFPLVHLRSRVKKSNLGNSGSHFKPGKKPKFVVHAAGDVGISGDGYRWRKYGQKMVKGNPHPRCMPILTSPLLDIVHKPISSFSVSPTLLLRVLVSCNIGHSFT